MVGIDDRERFGPWLARQLRLSGMTQAQLADSLELTRAAVSAWVTGRAEPREETVRAIAAVLGVEPAAVHNRSADVSTNRPLEWHHRPAHADGGREYGNAAAFAFDADLSVLAREATQNSIDERLDRTRPVQVRYTLHELSGEHLHDFFAAIQWSRLESHFGSAASTNQKVALTLRAALDDLATDERLLLLRVDDYNAAGLTGPEYEDGRYSAVVRRQLDSHKQAVGRAGGSYGMGKATLWATSRFGLVLINSTLSQVHEGRTERRLIGRLDLPWREVDDVQYAGPAWFGQRDVERSGDAVSRSWWADEETTRRLHLERSTGDAGTSFLIVGAHDASGGAETLQEMHEKLVVSLAEDFWAAMVSGRDSRPILEAAVSTWRNGQVLIPEETVDPHRSFPALSRALQAYLNGETVDELSAGDQVARIDVPLVIPPARGAGKSQRRETVHSAVLLLTPADDGVTQANNRVVYMRGNRMTIMKRQLRDMPLGATSFHAVLLAGYATGRTDDDVAEAEKFLRASEPPEHDRWDRTEELTTAYERGALSRLKEFLREVDKGVRTLLGRRETVHAEGPQALRELLKFNNRAGGGPRRTIGVPTVHRVNAHIEDSGSWQVRVDIRLPESEDPWVLTPVAKFDVRSGGRPTIEWKLLTPTQNCTLEEGNLVIPPGARSAAFVGLTEPKSHPVEGSLARLVVDVQRARGGAA